MLIMKKGSGDILASITAAVDDTEKNVKKLRSVWEGYFRNQERLRKKTLKLASFFRNFGDAEGGSTRELVHIISDTLLQCSELKLSSAKVFDPLGVLPDITRRVKVDVKNWESYSKVERKLQLQLQAAVLKDPTAETVGALKKNADNASLAVANGTKNVTTTASDYQREKYNSIKTACLQFLWNEMTTCARRLELVSAGYEQIHRTTGEFQDISGTLKKVLNAYRGATIGSIDSPTYTTRSEASSPALRSATSMLLARAPSKGPEIEMIDRVPP
ncbi:uncharacterized protein BJ171DRAFT_594810 [Polychytrium aggregatum]|uniref:uncharacterized protein n=1 Tax=Polychytrium aggregatum TaxID=110093 RepID=UPI0022FE2F64|nr:uncharacterized protein BJ171DRAFT_594810 [Polychytrium aggregatum]KAI9209793.1 hypothetical protein BJ171DRAFT_594810 [Polychytrium aggregatum]